MDDSAENNGFSSQTDTTDKTDITCLSEPLTSMFDSTAVNLENGGCVKIYIHKIIRHRNKDHMIIWIRWQFSKVWIIIGNSTEEAE